MNATLAPLCIVLSAAGCSLLYDASELTRDRPLLDADASAAADASTGGDADGAATTAFCSRAAHAFCDDFDRDGPAARDWSSSDVAPDGALGLVTTRSLSPPGALEAKHPGRSAAAGADTFSAVTKILSTPAQKVTVAFDVFVPKPPFEAGDVNMGIACVSLRRGGAKELLCVSVGETYANFALATVAPLAFDAWVHVVVTLDRGARAKGTIGGAPYETDPTRSSDPGPDAVELTVGVLGFNEPAPAFTAYFDNVTIDTF